MHDFMVAAARQLVRIRRFLVRLRVGVLRGRKAQMAQGEGTGVSDRRRDARNPRRGGAINEAAV